MATIRRTGKGTSIPTNFTTVTTTMATTSLKTVTVAPLQNDLPHGLALVNGRIFFGTPPSFSTLASYHESLLFVNTYIDCKKPES